MNERKIYLIRHGETPWTLSGQHTGTTDLELTPNGQAQAKALGTYLEKVSFEKILCSPLKRARQTCQLAHLENKAEITPDLREWNYGDYEGLTSAEIRKTHPNWTIFSQGAPNGESLEEIQARADRILAEIATVSGNIALFSHGHFLRALAASWLGLGVRGGAHLALSPGTVSILGKEKNAAVLLLWNAQPSVL